MGPGAIKALFCTAGIQRALAVASILAAAVGRYEPISAQAVAGGACKPAAERTGELGCWIIVHEAVGQMMERKTYGHLDTFLTPAAAEAAKGPHLTVVESSGKVCLLRIELKGWRPAGGERVAEIGPLPVKAGERYAARYRGDRRARHGGGAHA